MSEKNLTKKEAATPVNVERTHEWPTYVPDVDIVESKDCFVVKADIPGIEPQNVNITFEQNVLSIHAECSIENINGRQLISEFEPGDYERRFSVSNEIDASKIEAKTSNGVLTLTLPKAESAKPRKIEVKSV